MEFLLNVISFSLLYMPLFFIRAEDVIVISNRLREYSWSAKRVRQK